MGNEIKPTEPRRAFMLDLKIEADTRQDLVTALERFANKVFSDEVSTNGVSAGYNSSWTYTFAVDESITHDMWSESLNEYVAWLNHMKGLEE